MAEETPIQEAEPLGVGKLLSDSLRWFFRHFGTIIAVLIAGTLIMTAIDEVFPRGMFNLALYRQNSLGISGLDVIDTVNYFIGTTLVTIVVTQLIGNEKARQTSRPAGLLSVVLRYFFPVFFLTLAYFAAIIGGLLLLIIPGLIISVMWALYTPAVLLGGDGFGAFTRSAELTRGYRWPVFGATWLAAIIAGLGAVVWDLLVEQLATQVSDPEQIELIYFIGISFADLLVTAFIAVMVTLVYYRLIEIKEGTDISELEKVFE